MTILPLALALFMQADKAVELRRELDKHLNSGHAKLDKGELQGALSDYGKAIALDPNHARGYSGRGMAFYRLGRIPEATKDFNRALVIEPRHTYAWVGLGDVKGDAGDFDGAIAEYSKAIEVNPTSAQAYAGRGLAWAGRGEYDRAMPDFRRAADLLRSPADAWNFYYRGIGRHGVYEFEKAAADLAEAVKLDPKNSRFHLQQGKTFLALGKGQEAVDCFRKASSGSPKISVPPALHGDALFIQGRHAEAAEAWKKGVSPKDPRADEIRILVFVAQSRAGQDEPARADLESWLKDRKPAADEVVLLRTVSFLQGQTLEAEFLKDVDSSPDRRSREKACDLHFLAGQKRLLAGDAAAAQARFKHSVALNTRDRFSSMAASAELAK